jgi:Family of unknown function (DUF6174)
MSVRASSRRRPSLAFAATVLVAGIAAGCSLLPAPFGGAWVTPTPVPPATPPTAVIGGGVTRPELAEREAVWRATGVRTYSLTLSFLCECGIPSPLRIFVWDGTLMDVRDAAGDRAAAPGIALTVDGLFEQARTTIDGGGTVYATWDKVTGVPTSMTFDPIQQAIDDELHVTVDDFAPVSTPQPGPT